MTEVYTFNSLFEIPYCIYRAVTATPPETFNSLFEIRLYVHVANPNILLPLSILFLRFSEIWRQIFQILHEAKG